VADTNEIEFLEPVRKAGGTPSGSGRPGGSSLAVRIGIVAGSALLVLVGVAAVMGASPAPTTPAAPGANGAPGMPGDNPGGYAFGMRGGDFGGVGFNDIRITAISGSNLSLATADGWTRTIAATSTTTITKGAATITVGDLAVGDRVTFSQAKQADGSYAITAIRVILPSIGATIHVDATTTYQVQGVTSATLSDIKVGAYIVAQGTLRTDGSLDASVVSSGFRGGPGDGGGWGPGRGGHGPGVPDKDAAPSASPSAPATPG
jgi:hypothetical protein